MPTPIFPPTRLERIQPFGIEGVARAAERSADVLRLENLDTDLAPPAEAIAATRAAVGTDDANSYLPSPGCSRCAAQSPRAWGPRRARMSIPTAVS